jgi:hypothetical protein
VKKTTAEETKMKSNFLVSSLLMNNLFALERKKTGSNIEKFGV